MTYAIYKQGYPKETGTAVKDSLGTQGAVAAPGAYPTQTVPKETGKATYKGANSDNGFQVVGTAVGIHTIR
jgi:hypothetical protein